MYKVEEKKKIQFALGYTLFFCICNKKKYIISVSQSPFDEHERRKNIEIIYLF